MKIKPPQSKRDIFKKNIIGPVSGGDLTSLGKRGRSVPVKILAAVKMTFLVELAVDLLLGRGKFLL